MSTKNNPSKISDCYAKANPDEPMFVLLGRDKHAPQLVEMWAGQRAAEGEDPAKVEEALKCAKAMRRYRYERKGTPSCEYCEASDDISDCLKISTHVVTENGFLRWFWCGGFDPHAYTEVSVQTIEEYFAAEEVSYSEPKMVRIREKEAAIGGSELAFIMRLVVDRPAELDPEICQYRSDYDPKSLRPLGSACGKSATRMIHWRDGRMSPCCEDHGSNALPEETLKLVVKIEPIAKA